MAAAQPLRRSPTWAQRVLPSLRARFYLLLTALAGLALVPWLVTDELRRSTDGFAVAIQEAGSLRFRLLQVLVQLPQARTDPGTRSRLETMLGEQDELLDRAVSGDPSVGFAACPTWEVCERFKAHRTRWRRELLPRIRAELDSDIPVGGALVTDVLLELTELDLTVRAVARIVETRLEHNARLGSWASAGSVLLVALVAAGVGQIFGRIRRLRALVDLGDDRAIAAQIVGTDELDGLADALGRGIAVEREQSRDEARRAESLALQQLATRSVADALGAWLAGSGSLERALTEVAGATGHEIAELVPDSELAGRALRLRNPCAGREDSDEILIDTLSQVFSIACLAGRLLATKTLQGQLAMALGGLSGRPDAKEIGESLGRLIAHDSAVIELYDSEGRVEDTWAIHSNRLERVGALGDSGVPAGVRVLADGESGACTSLRQRCPGPQLVVPLRVNDQPIGVIYLARGRPEFTEQEARAATAMAPVAASALSRVQLEARLRFAEQWSTLGAFGRLLAHEIKNPLNSLGLELALLERRTSRLELASEDRDRVASSIAVVKSEFARLTSLTNEYLSMSPQSGSLELQRVDLNEIAGSVARAHAASMAEGGIHLEEHLAREPAWVLGHPDKLKQLMHNLVGNAIEAMAGTDTRVATLAVCRQGGDYELSVRDTGPGIADLVSIFTPGYTTKASGTGMGLALSQQIARQHGGRLLARAVDGGGAEFTLRIAAVDDEALG